MSMSTALAPPQPRAFCATIVRDAEVTVVGLAGEIDLFAADALEEALAAGDLTTIVAKVEAVGPSAYVTDLSLLENRFQFSRSLRS